MSSSELNPLVRLDVKFENKTWKHHYLEMHLQEFIENLAPEEYEVDKVSTYLHDVDIYEYRYLGIYSVLDSIDFRFFRCFKASKTR